jgi:hypothetical protein
VTLRAFVRGNATAVGGEEEGEEEEEEEEVEEEEVVVVVVERATAGECIGCSSEELRIGTDAREVKRDTCEARES